MTTTIFQLLANQPFMTIFFVLGAGYAIGRLSLGFFSVGSTAGSLLVALAVSGAAFTLSGVRFAVPDLVGTIFLALFTYAVGLRVGPQFVEGMRRSGGQLIALVMVTTTVAFLIAYGGSRALGLAPGFAPGILSGSNTISAVMGVATSAVDSGLYPIAAGVTAAEVKGNIAAGYSLTYIFSILSIVLLVRNLPAMFGIDPIAAGKRSEELYGQKGHALPGTGQAFVLGAPKAGVRVFRLTNEQLAGWPVRRIGEELRTPVLRLERGGAELALDNNPTLLAGDLLTVGGRSQDLIGDVNRIGPEVADDAAPHLDVDQAEIVVTRRAAVGKTLADLDVAGYAIRVRALFRSGHELPVTSSTVLERHDVVRVVGDRSAVAHLVSLLGPAVRPSDATDIITLGLGIGTGYLVGLVSIPIAGIPIGLGTMGGIVVAGMVVATLRAVNPAFGGPMPEGARAFLEGMGVDLFVTTLGLNVGPALVNSLAEGWRTVIVIALGIACATVPTFFSWLVGLYVFKMDPIILTGAVAGARNSTTAMKAISDKSHSAMPAFGYPVPYAVSTVVFLVYGYLAMVLS